MPCKFLTIKTHPTGKEVSPSDQEYQHLCSLKMESGEQRSIIHQIMVKKGIEHYITDDCPFAATGTWSKCPYNYNLV
ncbi:MAG: hypothetical protein AAB014_04615 [Nitrospirota bacterium]